jgi:hypothetical protein
VPETPFEYLHHLVTVPVVVGDAFLRNQVVTYDLSRSRMIFG